mgnify:FL=1
MKFYKKSLGQNFLKDKNIVRKILDLTKIDGKDIVEIGPGKGALTDEILRKKPKSLTLLEKDSELAKYLHEKYSLYGKIKIHNTDVLRFNFETLKKKKLILIGNLPYNISSQILIKLLKIKNIDLKISDLVLMFQKELGERIIAKYPAKHYGRLSIIAGLNLKKINKFFVSPNCFFPKPKVTSIVIHFKTFKNKKFDIQKITSLEKVTNVLFSNKRKKINKNIKKLLNHEKLDKIKKLDLNLRPENLEPKMFYKITEVFENS